MKLDDLYVAGTGVALPCVVPIAQAIERDLYSAHRAKESGQLAVAIAPPDVPAADMAVFAARDAIAGARMVLGHEVTPELLVHAVVHDAGLTGWAAAPYVQLRLGLPHVWGQEIRGGCNGIGALFSAVVSMIGTGAEVALVTAADSWQPDVVRAAPGVDLCDGGAAVVLTRGAGAYRVLSVTSVADAELEGLTRGSHPMYGQHPPTLDLRERANEWLNCGTMTYEKMWQRREAGIVTAVSSALEEADTPMGRVARVVVPHLHPALLAREILDPIGVVANRTTWDYGRNVGHIGAGDQFAGLDFVTRSGEVGKGDRVLMVGAGAGMSWGAAVLERTESR